MPTTDHLDPNMSLEEARAYIIQLASDIDLHIRIGIDAGEDVTHQKNVLGFFFDQVYNQRLDNVYGTQPEEFLNKLPK